MGREVTLKEVKMIVDVLKSASEEEIKKLISLEMDEFEMPGSNLQGWYCLGCESNVDREDVIYVKSEASLKEAMAVSVLSILEILNIVNVSIDSLEICWFTIKTPDNFRDFYEIKFGINLV